MCTKNPGAITSKDTGLNLLSKYNEQKIDVNKKKKEKSLKSAQCKSVREQI